MAMNVCPMCGKQKVIMWPQFWPYRRGDTYYCSEDCMIVAATKDQKMIKMIAHMRAKKGSKNMMKLTLEQKKKAVEIALSGKNPMNYLKECGIKAPDKTWYAIKAALKEKDPELYARIPDFRKADKETPEQAPTVKLSGPIRIETPEANKVEVVETPEDPPTRVIRRVCGKYEVSAIRVKDLGEFYYDIKYNSIDWSAPDGAEVGLSPNGWQNLMEELPGILSALGVKL